MADDATRARWRRNSATCRMRHGLHRGRCPADPMLDGWEESEARSWYERGLTVEETAVKIGRTYDQVHGALRRMGVAMRPRGRRKGVCWASAAIEPGDRVLAAGDG